MHIGGPKEGGTEFYKVLEGSKGFQGDSKEGEGIEGSEMEERRKSRQENKFVSSTRSNFIKRTDVDNNSFLV